MWEGCTALIIYIWMCIVKVIGIKCLWGVVLPYIFLDGYIKSTKIAVVNELYKFLCLLSSSKISQSSFYHLKQLSLYET